MKNIKRYISALLTICMVICTAPVFTSGAENVYDDYIIAEITEPSAGDEELQPMMANSCQQQQQNIYTSSSIPISGNTPNACYYWTAGGTSRGKVFSYAKMNSRGQTIWRKDIASHNGLPLHHDNISGPHQHNYSWSQYTNPLGQTFWNFIESVFGID